jgi:hypothetical protein
MPLLAVRPQWPHSTRSALLIAGAAERDGLEVGNVEAG